jgi:carbon monoxide dehydrogenase subunit G
VRLAHAVDVAAPLQRIWDALLDLPRLGRALASARVDDAVDGAHRARLWIGDREHRGTIRLVDADDDERVATLRVLGGRVAATVTVRASGNGEVARIAVEADVDPEPENADDAGQALATLLDDLAGGLAREVDGQAALQPVLERAALIAAGIAAAVVIHRVARRR